MRSASILCRAVFVVGVLSQAGCNIPLDGAGGGDEGGGSSDDEVSVVVTVGVSVGGSSCACGGEDPGAGGIGTGGCEATTGATTGTGGTSSTGGAGGTGATVGAGGAAGTGGGDGTGGAPGSTSGSGGAPGSTSGSGGQDAGSGGAPGGTGGQHAGSGGAPGGTGGQDAGSGGAPTACPGEVISLDVGDSLSVFGTMEGAFNLLDTCYEIEDGAEHTYDITIAQAGTLHLALVDSDSLDGMLVVTPACGDLSLQTCYDASPHGEETAFNVEPGTFSLIVEAMGGTTGDYVLNVTLDTPACGDGIVNGGEACDVGTGIPNDGCGDPGTPAACQIELPPPDVDVCPGEPVSLPEGTTSFFASDGYSTIGFDDSYGGTCRLQEGGHDRVFAMTPAISGTVTALVGYDAARTEPACYADWNSPHCWDQLIYARSSCTSDAPEDEMACADDTGGDGEQITFAVTAGVPFYLFVDGYDYEWFSEGPFNLFVDLTP